jgi:hypothetical protein
MMVVSLSSSDRIFCGVCTVNHVIAFYDIHDDDNDKIGQQKVFTCFTKEILSAFAIFE